MELRATPSSLLTAFMLSRVLVFSSVGESIEKLVHFTGFICGNDVICATSQPDKKIKTETAAECAYECTELKQLSASCVGVNYRQQTKQCEIFFSGPTSFASGNTGCQYFQVPPTTLTLETASKIVNNSHFL
jgi:hypothetical protein